MKSSESITDDVIAALRSQDINKAIRIADAHCGSKTKRHTHPGQVGITIKSAPRSIEERAANLATAFTLRPKILSKLPPEQWQGLYLNYAVWQLLGHVATEKCMRGFTGIGAMNPVTVTRMLDFHVGHLRRLTEWHKVGFRKGTIVCCNAGSCTACMALDKNTYSLDRLPELPYKDCTCSLGCRCHIRPHLDI